MWTLDTENNKWVETKDSVTKVDFDYLKQSLDSVRFYSRALSGATYYPVNDLNNIYDGLTTHVNRNWYVGGSYSISATPSEYPNIITSTSSNEYYNKFIPEYGLTLKNLFTPTRLINDSISNFIYVDACTTVELQNLGQVVIGLTIDGIRLKEGHRVLVKDQVALVDLSNVIDPDTYFYPTNYYLSLNQAVGSTSSYYYYNGQNGIYIYKGNKLIRESDLDTYDNCIRYSVYVKLGVQNVDKQFHLSRKRDGYYPMVSENDPIEFIERHNWIIRNRVDYNNVLDLNYYDVLKHGSQSYYDVVKSATFSIPERLIGVGEFGGIINYQDNVSHIMENKYKVNIRSVDEVDGYYWMCGDEGTILKVSKVDFSIEKIILPSTILGTLRSISFFNNLRGVVVGDFNTIFYTNNGGYNWVQISVPEFDPYSYNTVDYYGIDRIFIGGNSGVFLELTFVINKWIVTKKRIAKYLDTDDEYLLVENINDIIPFTTNSWGLSYSYSQNTVTELGYSASNAVSGLVYIDQSYGDVYNNFNIGDLVVIDDTTYSNIYGSVQETISGVSNDIVYNLSIGGPFLVGETIQGSISGATAVVLATYSFFFAEFINVGSDYGIFSTSDTIVGLSSSTEGNVVRIVTLVQLTDVTLNTPGLTICDVTNPVGGNVPLTFSYSLLPPNKESVMIVTNNSNLIIYSLNGFLVDTVNSDFLYLEFTQSYGDITSISLRENTTEFYFSSQEIYTFDINNFQIITSSSSNVVYGATGASVSYPLYVNKVSDYNGTEILVAGNNALLDFATYSYSIGILDTTFDTRLKSRLLFLDYDIAGKLNFFDDQQNYRMPNSLTFSGSSFTASSYINFDVLPGETNWLTYWKDREKTFEYYSSMDDAHIVLTSTTFSYSTQSVFGTYTASQIGISFSDIYNLAPRIGEDVYGRYIAGTGASVSNPSTSFDIYLYDYLMIARTLISDKSDVGDVIQMSSDVVNGEFTINKIFTSATYSYHYMFTDFNGNIINNLKLGTSSITLVNLNKYIDPSDFSYKFDSHPISNAYNATYSGGVVTIDNVFNRISAYYNLGTEVDLSGTTFSMTYDNTFLLFGYKPNYNILSFLENINSGFTASKELLAMPIYSNIPCGAISSSTVYIDTNLGFAGGTNSYWLNPSTPPSNKLAFGDDLNLEWESLFIYTYVDVSLNSATASYITDKLLIINKYHVNNFNNSGMGAYIIEFHKSMNYIKGDTIVSVSISSRRTLLQISDDLQDLNNIQRSTSVKQIQYGGLTYSNYESELNFKFPTDSYAKILLSDNDILSNLSAIVYVDYKNELSMNMTKLASEVEIPIISTSATFSNYLYISCSEKHGLVQDDGVLLEFNGGIGSSQELNPQYYGFHTVGGGDDYNFYVYTQFGVPSMISGDPGLAIYVKEDPFLNYEPVDLIDLGSDKNTKISVAINPENVKLIGSTYSLINIDTTKYKFKLYDGLTLEIINSLYPWLLEAEISDALIGMDSNKNLIWYTGIWYSGRWFGSSNGMISTWVSGIWVSGDWYGGVWKSNSIEDKLISVTVQNITNNINSIWFTGRWFDGTWQGGTWYGGRWYAGTWNGGDWYSGTWNDGTWNNGRFIGGIWVLGTWNNGIFNCDDGPSYWIDGSWNGGDFENGMWYTGVWDQRNNKLSRFGTRSYNSRTSTWHGGKWISGDFHSNINLVNGLPEVSLLHKLSIWKTGIWSNGDWYGGIAYNIDFRSGIWHGGILEDIEVIGIDTTNDTIQVNGIFKFNIGDNFTVIDDNIGGSFSVFGNNNDPFVYKVLNRVEDDVNSLTTLYVNRDLSILGTYSLSGYNLNLRVVSKFESANWESGIWTNGTFKDGSWNGGTWYNGVFESGSWG